MQRTEVDGVPVLWAERPGPLAGMLVFGTGSLDEGLDEQGFGFVVQEAAVADLDAPTATSNQTASDTTSFSVLGSPDEVATYFTALCGALCGPLDVESVDMDDRFVDYLLDPAHRDPWAAAVTRRLRVFDRWPAVPSPDAAKVAHFRDTWFTAGNAVLVLTGAPPAALRLPLPPGPRPARPVRVPTGMSPSWYADSVAAPGLSFVTTDAQSAYPVMRVLTRRIDRALEEAREPVECFPDAVGFAADGYRFGYSIEDTGSGEPSADALRALLPSAVMVVPAGARPTLPGLSEFSCAGANYIPPGDEIRPPLLKRHSTKLRLIVSTDSVSTVDEAGAMHTIPLNDLLVLGGDGLWLGHAGHGCSTDVSAYAGVEERLAGLVAPQRHRVTR